MNIQRELHNKERQDTRAAIGEHKQRELPLIGGNNCPKVTLSFNELFNEQVLEAYFLAIEYARDECGQVHANKIMAQYELGDLSANQAIKSLDYIS